jgi:hypothetical protein
VYKKIKKNQNKEQKNVRTIHSLAKKKTMLHSSAAVRARRLQLLSFFL